jgi:hypothetical protein
MGFQLQKMVGWGFAKSAERDAKLTGIRSFE